MNWNLKELTIKTLDDLKWETIENRRALKIIDRDFGNRVLDPKIKKDSFRIKRLEKRYRQFEI